MKIHNKNYRTIWPCASRKAVHIIDQTRLPFVFETIRIDNLPAIISAIKTMQVRGAPLIGVAAAYGVALSLLHENTDTALNQAANELIASRPTAVNLAWAVQRMLTTLAKLPLNARLDAAWQEAIQMAEEDVLQNQQIAKHGLALIKQAYKHQPFNILTHCNAGWLATVDHGTALAPIYAAHDAGFKLHVWVDETRPRNQGASLSAWELSQHGVPHTVITDNAGGHMMQIGQVDMVIVGADRVAKNGDVCNKIGTYLKALAAFDNNIPFYVAVPSPTVDWQLNDGSQIHIEQRSQDEVAYIQGLSADGSLQSIRIMPVESRAINPAFDVTPARLVTGIITEHGVYAPDDLIRVTKPCN